MEPVQSAGIALIDIIIIILAICARMKCRINTTEIKAGINHGQ